MALLDRVGLAPVALIARAALPGRAPRTVFDRLVKLYRHGLIARHTTGLHGHSSRRQAAAAALPHPPRPRSRTAAPARPGDLPQTRMEADRATPRRAARARPSRTRMGDRVPPRRRRARYRPLAHAPLRHGPISSPPNRERTAPSPDHAQRDPGPRRPGDHRRRAQDVLRDQARPVARAPHRALKLTFDLLVEIDLTARPSYNREKFLAYDAFLTGWSLAHPRYQAQATRPAVLFVSPNNHAALACAREADELMTGRIGAMGAPAEHWYYAGRDHLFFAAEGDIHRGDLSALALPPQPRGLRERLMGDRELALSRVSVLTDPGRDVV